jgi:hypothetical protein
MPPYGSTKRAEPKKLTSKYIHIQKRRICNKIYYLNIYIHINTHIYIYISELRVCAFVGTNTQLTIKMQRMCTKIKLKNVHLKLNYSLPPQKQDSTTGKSLLCSATKT